MKEVLRISSVNVKLVLKYVLRIFFIVSEVVFEITSISSSQFFTSCYSDPDLIWPQVFIDYFLVLLCLHLNDFYWRLEFVVHQ